MLELTCRSVNNIVFLSIEYVEFCTNNHNLREVLLFRFHLKKSAAKSQQILSEAYGDYTTSISTCEYFWRYKKGDREGKKRPDQPKKFEDEEVEALLDQEQSQTEQEKLVESLNVNQRFPDVWKPLEWFKSKKIAVRVEAKGYRKAQNNLWIVVSKTQKKKFFASYRDRW